MEMTRKDILKLGVLDSAALAIPMTRPAKSALSLDDRMPESWLPKPFTTNFTIPPIAQPLRRNATTDFYEMIMKQGYPEILPGMKTEVWGYEGHTPTRPSWRPEGSCSTSKTDGPSPSSRRARIVTT